MAYKDPAQQLAYQKRWMVQRRLEWVTSVGGACFTCGSTTDLHMVDYTGGAHQVWSLSAAKRAEALRNARLLCGVHFQERLNATRPARPITHGLAHSYRRGCRCESCVAAQKVARQKWRRGAAATIAPLASGCRWCGSEVGPFVKGKGVSSAELFHVECSRAVELFNGWDRSVDAVDDV